jgi:hypothetical protein
MNAEGHLLLLVSDTNAKLLMLFSVFSTFGNLALLRTLFLLGHSIGLQLIIVSLVFIGFVIDIIPKKKNYIESDRNNTTPEETSRMLSKLTFSWMSSLMKLGNEKILTMDDLWFLSNEDSAPLISLNFEDYLFRQLNSKNPSLVMAMIHTFGATFLVGAAFKVLQHMLQFTQPQLLKLLVNRELIKIFFAPSHAEGSPIDPIPYYKGYLLAALMFITAVTQTALLHQYFHTCFMLGMRLRTALITAVYKKALKLSNQSRQDATIGEITNLMAVDASKIADLTTYLNILWSGPFQIFVATYLL